MADAAQARDGRFTYADYKAWPDGERWELIEGRAYDMSPAPGRKHQGLISYLAVKVGRFLERRTGKFYLAPFDVLFPSADEADDEVDTVVQPDLVVYLDESKLTKAGARGAPDLVMEILSPGTSRKDQHEKFDLYRKSGVREYWIIDAKGSWLCVYRLDERGEYGEGELREPLGAYGPIASSVLEGFSLDPEELFSAE